MSTSDEPFFRREGDMLVPNPVARGPWQGAGLHGRVIVGLLASEIERRHGDPGFMPARVTVDLYRAPPMEPLRIETRMVRESRRIRVADAEMISQGRSAGRASIQFLVRGDQPQGDPWRGPGAEPLVDPESLPETEPGDDTMFGLWDMRWVRGNIRDPGPRFLWMRENRALVGGEALTPFARVAVAADYASPLANMCGGPGYTFINSDLTIYLGRLPEGEWIGFEAIAHEASDGVAVGHCNLYDAQGRIGWASACGLAQLVRPDG